MDRRILATNIQRFSLHDGPGIRTTVFCKGCSLRCPWCSNPENLKPYLEQYAKDGREGIYGRYMTCDEVYDEVVKDKIFYHEKDQVGVLADVPGGVTFSGGEPLLQMTALEPLMEQLKANGVHLCIETALFVSDHLLKIALQYIDLFYVDVKILNADRCRRILNGNLEEYLANVVALFATQKPVVFRIPVIGGFTDEIENRIAVINFIKQYRPIKVELIKEHNLGRSKYLTLGKEPLKLDSVTDALMMLYREEIIAASGFKTEICKV